MISSEEVVYREVGSLKVQPCDCTLTDQLSHIKGGGAVIDPQSRLCEMDLRSNKLLVD